MKKILTVAALLAVFAGSVHAEDNADFIKNAYINFKINSDGYKNVYVTPEQIHTFDILSGEYVIEPRNKFKLGKDGYFYYDDVITIPGAIEHVYFRRYEYENPETEEGAKYRGIFYNSRFKAKYSASSELSENTKKGTVVYKAENLGQFAYEAPSWRQYYEPWLYWNFESKPWVEGSDGYGIGETINITTTHHYQMTGIIILNGYVDLEKRDLYKKNSRVKTFTVKDKVNYITYTFELEDCVEFQQFFLQKSTNNIELIIEDVYKGDKWSDTCITAIIPEDQGGTGSDVKLYQKYTCDRGKEYGDPLCQDWFYEGYAD